jgi:hypothetical protein
MLSLFNAGTAGGGRDFSYGLRRARLDLIISDPQYSRWFATPTPESRSKSRSETGPTGAGAFPGGAGAVPA